MADQKNMICLKNFEEFAKVSLPYYVFCFYSGGANDEITLNDNTKTFDRYRLMPRVLRDVSTRDLHTTILGHRIDFPVGIAPSGMQKLAHTEGETATVRATDDALAAECGVAGVWVSNHGGRQLDTVPATIDVLRSVVRAVAGRCEVYLDGGVWHGTDILKAIALGANAVLIGRPALYGFAYNGEEGVTQILSILKEEFSTALALSGCASLSDVKPELVIHESQLSGL